VKVHNSGHGQGALLSPCVVAGAIQKLSNISCESVLEQILVVQYRARVATSAHGLLAPTTEHAVMAPPRSVMLDQLRKDARCFRGDIVIVPTIFMFIFVVHVKLTSFISQRLRISSSRTVSPIRDYVTDVSRLPTRAAQSSFRDVSTSIVCANLRIGPIGTAYLMGVDHPHAFGQMSSSH
jgi:hypothetical protein